MVNLGKPGGFDFWDRTIGNLNLAFDWTGNLWSTSVNFFRGLLGIEAPPLIYSDNPNVSEEFTDKVREISDRLGIDPNYLMAVMHFETGGSFDPKEPNPKSTAVGLIQFIEETADYLGTTTEELASMTALEQLDYVEDYLSPYAGRMNSVLDVYMAVFSPTKGLNQPDSYELYTSGSLGYEGNYLAFDTNGDEVITIGEIRAVIERRYRDGFD